MNFSDAVLSKLTLHFVGNKIVDGKFIANTDLLSLSEDLKNRLAPFYVSKFSTVPDRYKFYHLSDLKFNEAYNFISGIFESPDRFGELSKEIARHLFEKSVHPNIKPGELHIVYFTGCEYNDKTPDVVRIFKTEDKSGFFEVAENAESLHLNYKEGIDSNKFEKGCLIFNTSQATGYEVCIIDKQNRAEEAKYWMDDFLGLLQISNDFSQTNDILSIAKNYIVNQLEEDFEASKTDKIDLLNRSIDYFKTHDSFDKKEFEEEVFYHPEMISSFRNFDNQYRQQHEIEIDDSFDISLQAVKKQARVFKSVLKLDRNFHIYIHGNKEMIEKGVEKDGRKFYKIYYENES